MREVCRGIRLHAAYGKAALLRVEEEHPLRVVAEVDPFREAERRHALDRLVGLELECLFPEVTSHGLRWIRDAPEYDLDPLDPIGAEPIVLHEEAVRRHGEGARLRRTPLAQITLGALAVVRVAVWTEIAERMFRRFAVLVELEVDLHLRAGVPVSGEQLFSPHALLLDRIRFRHGKGSGRSGRQGYDHKAFHSTSSFSVSSR